MINKVTIELKKIFHYLKLLKHGQNQTISDCSHILYKTHKLVFISKIAPIHFFDMPNTVLLKFILKIFAPSLLIFTLGTFLWQMWDVKGSYTYDAHTYIRVIRDVYTHTRVLTLYNMDTSHVPK